MYTAMEIVGGLLLGFVGLAILFVIVVCVFWKHLIKYHASLVVLLCVLGTVFSTQAVAQANPKLNVAQALSLLSALRNLDGHQVIIKQNGQDVTIMQPWDFGSGLLRLKIANDITILAAVEKAADDARQATIKELMKDKPAGYSIQTDQSVLEEFGRQYAEILNPPAKGSDDLARIKASELKLEKNEIPVTALSALAPILDMDVSLK